MSCVLIYKIQTIRSLRDQVGVADLADEAERDFDSLWAEGKR